ncbi:hypothetical protein HKBW3S03_02161, partial [Candidatus Hakubella thermalkaliphila]
RLPSPSWAELLSGFSWVFNLREGNGELIYPDREEGELICAVKKGIPDWPEPTQWDDESVILKWNYQFTENYLKQSELDKIRLTAPRHPIMDRGGAQRCGASFRRKVPTHTRV